MKFIIIILLKIICLNLKSKRKLVINQSLDNNNGIKVNDITAIRKTHNVKENYVNSPTFYDYYNSDLEVHPSIISMRLNYKRINRVIISLNYIQLKLSNIITLFPEDLIDNMNLNNISNINNTVTSIELISNLFQKSYNSINEENNVIRYAVSSIKIDKINMLIFFGLIKEYKNIKEQNIKNNLNTNNINNFLSQKLIEYENIMNNLNSKINLIFFNTRLILKYLNDINNYYIGVTKNGDNKFQLVSKLNKISVKISSSYSLFNKIQSTIVELQQVVFHIRLIKKEIKHFILLEKKKLSKLYKNDNMITNNANIFKIIIFIIYVIST